MSLSGRTISRLAAPFEGGSGPSHSTIESIWLSEDASDYLPSEGNKADRVRGGLKALRDGRAAGQLGPALLPNPEKLQRVAEDLAERLISYGAVTEEDVAEALDGTPLAPPPRPVSATRSSQAPADAPDSGPIFVVHGHDHGLLHQAVRVLERATSREVVVLHEQPNAGRTIIEKFEAHAVNASYAVVLLTPDDKGGALGRDQQSRARQNVIFELGFFFGRLGRRRVAVLLAPEVEQPSDITGLLYIPVDSSGSWKFVLARELRESGISVAMDRIP
jgi:predicted nucleotide-binding protein